MRSRRPQVAVELRGAALLLGGGYLLCGVVFFIASFWLMPDLEQADLGGEA